MIIRVYSSNKRVVSTIRFVAPLFYISGNCTIGVLVIINSGFLPLIVIGNDNFRLFTIKVQRINNVNRKKSTYRKHLIGCNGNAELDWGTHSFKFTRRTEREFSKNQV